VILKVLEIVKNKNMKSLLKVSKLVVRFPHSWSNFKTELNWTDDDSTETFLSLEQTVQLRDFLNDIIESFPIKENKI